MSRLFIVPPAANITIVAVATAAAVWRGGWRGRVLGAAYAVQTAINFADVVPGGAANHVHWGSRDLAENIVALALCLVCLRGARRYWVIWASAFTLLSLITDVVFLAVPHITTYAFLSAEDIWGYGMAAALVSSALPARREAAA